MKTAASQSARQPQPVSRFASIRAKADLAGLHCPTCFASFRTEDHTESNRRLPLPALAESLGSPLNAKKHAFLQGLAFWSRSVYVIRAFRGRSRMLCVMPRVRLPSPHSGLCVSAFGFVDRRADSAILGLQQLAHGDRAFRVGGERPG